MLESFVGPLGKVAVTLASVTEVNQGEIHGLPLFFFFFRP